MADSSPGSPSWPRNARIRTNGTPAVPASAPNEAPTTAIAADDLVAADWLRLKRLGLSDADIAEASGATEDEARSRRRAWAVRPAFRRVDSCAAEVEVDRNDMVVSGQSIMGLMMLAASQ